MSQNLPSPSDSASKRLSRNLVTRADGKLVNVARRTGQIFVCKDG